MVNIENFEKALKVKRLKRMLNSNDVWKVIPERYGIDKVCRYGKNYLSTIMRNIRNPFWVSMTKALIHFELIFDSDNIVNNPRNIPIWFNPDINLPFIKKWDDKGIRWIGDIFDTDGEMLTRIGLYECFNVNINFIDYMRLTRAIPPELKILIERSDDDIGPRCQQHILTILGDNKSNQMVKKQFTSKNSTPLSPVCKWKNELLTPDDEIFWNKIFVLPKTCNRDTWMQMCTTVWLNALKFKKSLNGYYSAFE